MLMETNYIDTFRPEIESTVNTGYRRKAYWLDRAINLDIYLGAPGELMNYITNEMFDEIIKIIGQKRNHNRLKAALKSIIINLYTSHTVNVPLRYSRSKDDYGRDKRYGKLFFKHSRVIPIFDALEELGYIHQKKGYHFNHDSKQTRAWASDKMITHFHKYGLEKIEIEKEPRKELITLNIKKYNGDNEKKVEMPYSDTEQTIEFRNNIVKYNSYISKQDIKIDIQGNAKTNYSKLYKLCIDCKSGIVIPLFIDYRQDYLSDNNIDNNNAISINTYTITRSIRDKTNNINEISNEFLSTAVEPSNHQCRYNIIASRQDISRIMEDINKVIDEAGSWKEAFRTKVMTKKHKLSDLGIHRMVFGIRYNYLHRVFNNGSFDDGGRFYGAFHIGTNKDWRKRYILLNGSPTVELDYSAHHIRILFHLEGVEYDDDPYAILCKKPEERRIYKKILLTAINADSEKSAIYSFIDKAEKDEKINRRFSYHYARRLLNNFKCVHKPIAKYICSGIGVRLMNIDSRITEAILMRMTRENIPCLPVHDSYIVPAEHKDTLNQVMVEEYEKIMGGLPIIKQS